MRSGQQLVANPLGIVISTAYPTLKNPMTEEVQIAEDKISNTDDYRLQLLNNEANAQMSSYNLKRKLLKTSYYTDKV